MYEAVILTDPEILDELVPVFEVYVTAIKVRGVDQFSGSRVPADEQSVLLLSWPLVGLVFAHTSCPAHTHPPDPSFSQKSHSLPHFQPHRLSASFASVLVIHTPLHSGGVKLILPNLLAPVDVKS